MRQSPTRFEQRVTAALKEHGELRYTELLKATEASSAQMLARTLNRMRHRGLVTRTVVPSTPIQTLYALAKSEGDRAA
jgi:DNA-binding HxlR family transcriptional regulator